MLVRESIETDEGVVVIAIELPAGRMKAESG
jgi:hypothetical protein